MDETKNDRMEWKEAIIGFLVTKKIDVFGKPYINTQPLLFPEDAEDAGIGQLHGDIDSDEEILGILPAPPKSYLVTVSEYDGAKEKFLRYILGGEDVNHE